jgi:gamma-glutamylcysteine synthetase
VGITSSGLDNRLADNVNYAIKTKYLNLLIEEINEKIELPKTVLSKTTLLTEKIKSLSKYVVFIKVK